MGRRKSGLDIHGILLLDKPAGRSSNHALQDVRRLFNARKAGHTGNLDPFATGMLPICLGEATKTAAYMLDSDKCYMATALLGVATNTGDIEGDVVEESEVGALTEADIESAMDRFRGEIEQVPPMYSALKHQGKPLYQLAREGIEIERKSRPVTIHELELVAWESPSLTFQVKCSKGTYIRTLGEDLAGALDTCAHLQSLRRLSVSPFESGEMLIMDEIRDAVAENRHLDLLLPIDAGLVDWDRIVIAPSQEVPFGNGNAVPFNPGQPGMVRVYNEAGKILGLAECQPDGNLQPRRLFVH